VNGFNYLLDSIAGIRRVPAPAGWTGPWPNLGSEEEFLTWLEQQITACDLIVKVRKGPIRDPKWKTAHHARRQHCYWLILRKSKKCE
jgi:hypothetical protein